MKRYSFSVLLSLSVLLINIKIFSQSGWVWQNPMPQGNFMTNLQFVNSSTAFCLTYINVLKSTDAGNTWQLKWTNVQQYHESLYFTDVNTGYLLCDSGMVLKTTNSGENWTVIYNFGQGVFHKIHFINQLTGFALRKTIYGWQGTVMYRTVNGGFSWSNIMEDTSFTLKYFSFADQNTGYIAANYSGNYYSKLKLFKTINSGAVWDSIPVNMQNEVYGINFFDQNTGLVYGFGIQSNSILRTTNGGINWTGLYGASISDMSFVNNNTGYALRYYNEIIKTINGGMNWNIIGSIYLNSSDRITEIEFTSENYGFCSGDVLAKTTNGASNWINVSGEHVDWIWAVDFENLNTGYASGNYLMKTTNAGNNWFKLPSDSGFNPYAPIEFINSETGYSSSLGSDIRLMKTTNGGYNWLILDYGMTGQLNEIQFLNDNTGYILGKYSVAFKTTNAGLTWSLISGYGYGYQESLYFYNESLGFIGRREGSSGECVICRTTNGGISWDTTHFNSTWATDFYFINQNTGFVSIVTSSSFSKMYKTTNGGINWFIDSDIIPAYIFSIQFINENTGYASLNGGKLLKTTNSGNNWIILSSITDNSLCDLYFFNENTGILVGSGSTILKTTNGGGSIGIQHNSNEIPNQINLYQNYPNPFNPVTNIKFAIPNFSQSTGLGVRVTVYDILGREVKTLINEKLTPGTYEVLFDGSGFATGLYFCNLYVTDGTGRVKYTKTQKMMLVK